ncbi:hypothetical protein [Piscinibacter terrae]|uniref:hypothetical protein n=1 Tax=Piscinibacter terrae TaxID=2496871 RepID=UPI000F5B32B6|nr:hypothetical protein [Albitalea terrae]
MGESFCVAIPEEGHVSWAASHRRLLIDHQLIRHAAYSGGVKCSRNLSITQHGALPVDSLSIEALPTGRATRGATFLDDAQPKALAFSVTSERPLTPKPRQLAAAQGKGARHARRRAEAFGVVIPEEAANGSRNKRLVLSTPAVRRSQIDAAVKDTKIGVALGVAKPIRTKKVR